MFVYIDKFIYNIIRLFINQVVVLLKKSLLLQFNEICQLTWSYNLSLQEKIDNKNYNLLDKASICFFEVFSILRSIIWKPYLVLPYFRFTGKK